MKWKLCNFIWSFLFFFFFQKFYIMSSDRKGQISHRCFLLFLVLKTLNFIYLFFGTKNVEVQLDQLPTNSWYYLGKALKRQKHISFLLKKQDAELNTHTCIKTLKVAYSSEKYLYLSVQIKTQVNGFFHRKKYITLTLISFGYIMNQVLWKFFYFLYEWDTKVWLCIMENTLPFSVWSE